MAMDTSALPASEQFGAWASAMPAYAVHRRFPASGFSAVTRAWFVPPVVFTHSRLDPVRFQRGSDAYRLDGLDSVTLQLFRSGRMRGTAAGTVMRAEAGSIALQDAALSLEATVTATDTVTATIPRALLDDACPGLDVHGVVLRDGAARPLAAFLDSLPTTLDEIDAAVAARLPAILRDLLIAALTDRRSRPSPSNEDRPLRDRVRRFVACNLGEPLDMEAICAATNASRASIYRAFAGQGGVMAFVLDRRLDRVRRCLNDRADERSIAQIAAATGFRSASELGRAFRRRFSATPGDVRRAQRDRRAPTGPAQARFRAWVECDLAPEN